MSDSACNSLLKCISEILPPPNKCPKTKGGLISEAADLPRPTKMHKIFSICATCGSEYDDGKCCVNAVESQIAIFDAKTQCDAIVKGNNF